MPLFNGNILQIHALLIAAYAGVAKGIANKGKKPDVCTTYPQQYENWYSMDAEGRSAEHTALYNEWRDRVLRKLHARHGGAPAEVGAAAAAAMPGGTSNINRARARDSATATQERKIADLFSDELEREREARSALMGELSERTEPTKMAKYLSKLHSRDANDGVMLVTKVVEHETPSPSATAYAEHVQRLSKITYGTRNIGELVDYFDTCFHAVASEGHEVAQKERFSYLMNAISTSDKAFHDTITLKEWSGDHPYDDLALWLTQNHKSRHSNNAPESAPMAAGGCTTCAGNHDVSECPVQAAIAKSAHLAEQRSKKAKPTPPPTSNKMPPGGWTDRGDGEELDKMPQWILLLRERLLKKGVWRPRTGSNAASSGGSSDGTTTKAFHASTFFQGAFSSEDSASVAHVTPANNSSGAPVAHVTPESNDNSGANDDATQYAQEPATAAPGQEPTSPSDTATYNGYVYSPNEPVHGAVRAFWRLIHACANLEKRGTRQKQGHQTRTRCSYTTV